MKRLLIIIMIIAALAAFAACGAQEEPEAAQTPVPVSTYDESASLQDDEGGEAYTQLEIGFSLAGVGAFYEQLVLDIERECGEMNYIAHIKTAATVEEQSEHIRNMLSTGVAVIAIDPVDVDALEQVLAECETQNVPVINIIDSINGLVSTLIAPDYISIGKSAGRDAVELFGSSDGNCMVLKTDYASFTMQLMSDGFLEEIDKDRDVSLISEHFCGDDEESAYFLTKAELLKEGSDINFIFAQSEAIGRGALRAIEELGSDIKMTVFGGDMTLISAVVEGKVHSCIFFGPAQLANETVFYADRFVKSESYDPPQYSELRIEAAQGSDADDYSGQGGLHAQIIGG